MIKICLIEDNARKINAIRQLLLPLGDAIDLHVANDVTAGRAKLETQFYDLVLLDLNIPKRFGDDPKGTNSQELLQDLHRGHRLIKPSHIIGLTEFDALLNEYEPSFRDQLWHIILYDETSNTWENLLVSKLNYLISAKRTLLSSANRDFEYDVAIITALRTPELKAVLNLPLQWSSFKVPNDATEYHTGSFRSGSNTIRVVAAAAPQMGMIAASTLTMKMIHNFRPRYVIMTGIAAGVKSNKIELGDVLVGKICFDADSGKKSIGQDGKPKFEPDPNPIEMNRDIVEELISCQGTREFLDEIWESWTAEKPTNHLNIRIGPLASNSSVIIDPKWLDNVKSQFRKLVGVDMESYGVYYACANCSKPKPLAAITLKCVSDFADDQKEDKFQNFASYVSAQFAMRFFEKRLFPIEATVEK